MRAPHGFGSGPRSFAEGVKSSIVAATYARAGGLPSVQRRGSAAGFPQPVSRHVAEAFRCCARMPAADGRCAMAAAMEATPTQGAPAVSKFIRYGGIAASVMLIAFGIGSIYAGFDGRDRVQSDLAREQIVGTPDSTIPGQKVDTGSEAQAFAAVIRTHTLEATGRQDHAPHGRLLAQNGQPISDEKA